MPPVCSTPRPLASLGGIRLQRTVLGYRRWEDPGRAAPTGDRTLLDAF